MVNKEDIEKVLFSKEVQEDLLIAVVKETAGKRVTGFWSFLASAKFWYYVVTVIQKILDNHINKQEQ
jgi:hypothetical protein